MSRTIAVASSAESVQGNLLSRSFAGIGQGLAAFCRELTRDAVSPYRPEKHYMRGPGPAWQAKYGTSRAGHAAD